VDQPYPLPIKALKKFLKPYKTVLILEETSPLIELQLADGLKLCGRRDGSLPAEGELTLIWFIGSSVKCWAGSRGRN